MSYTSSISRSPQHLPLRQLAPTVNDNVSRRPQAASVQTVHDEFLVSSAMLEQRVRDLEQRSARELPPLPPEATKAVRIRELEEDTQSQVLLEAFHSFAHVVRKRSS
jgi:hypothetical protein